MILGILEIGKMKPERRKEGRKVRSTENIKANCWERVMVEMKSPIPKPQIRKTPETQKRKNIFPLRGTLNRSVPTRTTSEIWIIPKKK